MNWFEIGRPMQRMTDFFMVAKKLSPRGSVKYHMAAIDLSES